MQNPQLSPQSSTTQKTRSQGPWLAAVAVSAALGMFGGYALQQSSQAAPLPASQAERGPAAQTPVSPTMQPALFAQGSQGYSEQRARTESEANTVEVVKARQSGLVFISVTESSTGNPASELRQRLRERFNFPFDFDLPEGGGGGEREGSGSGFFVSKNGDIITNNHVVEGASEITVRLFGNKQTYKAKVISRAPDYDLALIRVEGVKPADVNVLPLGNSDSLQVGLKAIAMGAPFGLDFSVSEGIVSSVARTVPVGTRGVSQRVIQTDAAINPGNSGGPLLNSAGEVIGVNTQILTGGIGQSAGVGFAVPVNVVRQLLPQLQAGKGDIKTPTLGIQFTDLSALTPEQRQKAKLPATGALLQRVFPNSPAARAGLKGGNNLALNLTEGRDSGGSRNSSAGNVISTNGDVIVAVDGKNLEEGEDLRRAVFGKTIGDEVKLSILRGGKRQDVSVKLEAFDFPQAEE